MKRHARIGGIVAGVTLALGLAVSGATAQEAGLDRSRTAVASGIVGIKHVGVPVRDPDRALAFYTTVLGFEVAVDEALGSGARWIELAVPESSTRVLLLTGPDVEDRVGSFTNIVFMSRDVTASYESMRAAGVVFDMAPTALPGGGTNAVFRDPDGNAFALATPDVKAHPIPSGNWSATLREPDGRGVPFDVEVATTDDATSITFVIQGTRLSTTNVRVSGARIRFVWDLDPGPLVVCVVDRRPDGAFEGDCVDQDEGDRKRLTLRPPGG